MAQRSHSLLFGTTHIKFQAARDRFARVRHVTPPPMEAWDLERLLVAPTVGPRLEDVVRPGDSVLVVLPDRTHKSASAQLLPLLLERLGKAGAGVVRAIVASEGNRPPTREELMAIMGRAHGWIEVLEHNAHSTEGWACFCNSSDLHAAFPCSLMEAEKVLAIGAVRLHSRMGFTGGPSTLFPGLADACSIARWELQTLDLEEGSLLDEPTHGCLVGYPPTDRLLEVVRSRIPDFGIQVLTDPKGRVLLAASGDFMESFRSVASEAQKLYPTPIDAKAPLIVASAGGYPRDRDLIQVLPALESACGALEENGVLILSAGLQEGYGSDSMRSWLEFGSSETIWDALREIVRRDAIDASCLHAAAALRVRCLAERFEICLVSNLSDRDVCALGMRPFASVDEALAFAKELQGGELPGLVVRHAGDLVLEPR